MSMPLNGLVGVFIRVVRFLPEDTNMFALLTHSSPTRQGKRVLIGTYTGGWETREPITIYDPHHGSKSALLVWKTRLCVPRMYRT